MPRFPLIDTHLHIWDQSRIRLSAFEGSPLFGHPYHVEDYRRDCGSVEVEAMVFLECYADFWEGGGQYIEEVEFVEDEARRDPRIRRIIAMAPVEWGRRVEPMLVEMRDKHPLVGGIRRIMEFDKDPRGLTLSPGFIEGVNLLEKFGWTFDIMSTSFFLSRRVVRPDTKSGMRVWQDRLFIILAKNADDASRWTSQ